MISIITDCIVIWSIERGAHTVMEPLAALSVAGTVVQFVQFASALFTGSRKIYNSTSGGSEENERLDFIYNKLSDFSTSLETDILKKRQGIRSVASGLPKDIPSLADLATKCREDCSKLLKLVDRMKMGAHAGPKVWRSFRVAMMEVSKSSEITQLQAHIEGYQKVMVLHFCSVSTQVFPSRENYRCVGSLTVPAV